MKALMISDHPNWCALMMNGKKKIEVRSGTALYKATQKLIDEYGYAEFYVYCTKGKQGIFKERHNGYTLLNQNKWIQSEMNGKVIFKFRCYNVEEISYLYRSDFTSVYTNTLDTEDLEKQACLTKQEFRKYLLGNIGYAIHISDLEIFDEPKELSEFKRYGGLEYAMKNADNPLVDDNWNDIVYLSKAPQSFMFIESENK